jgi:hypothetical protein
LSFVKHVGSVEKARRNRGRVGSNPAPVDVECVLNWSTLQQKLCTVCRNSEAACKAAHGGAGGGVHDAPD